MIRFKNNIPPGREHSEDRNEIIDVDPEMIKKGVRNLMHEVCQIEREKVSSTQVGHGGNNMRMYTLINTYVHKK